MAVKFNLFKRFIPSTVRVITLPNSAFNGNKFKPLPIPGFTSPFSTWDLNQATQALYTVDMNRQYRPRPKPSLQHELVYGHDDSLCGWYMFEGDHWLNGAGWIGPWPGQSTRNNTFVCEEIRRQFISKNIIAEVVNRHVDSVLGRIETSWSLAVNEEVLGVTFNPTKPDNNPGDDQGEDDPEVELTPEEKLIGDTMPYLKEWWIKNNVTEEIRKAVNSMLVCRRGNIRLFIPVGLIPSSDGTIPSGATIAQYLNMIHIQATFPESCAKVYDPNTMSSAHVFIFRQYEPTSKINVSRAEIAFVDPSTNLTNVRLFSQNKVSAVDDSAMTIDLNGNNLYYEIQRDPLITAPVRSMQKAYNLAVTMMNRNVVLGGFLERVILSADLPGTWVNDPTAPDGRRYEPAPLQIGGGKTTFLQPLIIEDEEGKRTFSKPDIRYRDPVTPATFVESKIAYYTDILQEVEQTHMIFAGSSIATGDARVQAKASFATSLVKTKIQVEGLVIWMIDTVLKMVSNFDHSDEFQNIKPICKIRPDTGPLTAAERVVVMDQYKNGLISREGAMILLGVDDVDQEIRSIEAQKLISTPSEIAEILTALSKTGWELAWDQLPEVDTNILGLKARDVPKYIEQLKQIAEMSAPAGGNTGSGGGSKEPSKPKTQDPGPGVGAGTG